MEAHILPTSNRSAPREVEVLYSGPVRLRHSGRRHDKIVWMVLDDDQITTHMSSSEEDQVRPVDTIPRGCHPGWIVLMSC